MNLDIGDKVRFKTGAYSTLKMGGTQVEWRLGLGGLIGEVEYKHWRGGTLPDLYRVRVHHPKSGITVTDDFDLNEIEGHTGVHGGFGHPIAELALHSDPESKPCFECGETDQTHDFKCSKHPSNVVVLPDPVDAMVAYHRKYSAPNPLTDNAVTGGLSRDPGNSRRCPYSPAECGRPYCPHGLYCAHGKGKP